MGQYCIDSERVCGHLRFMSVVGYNRRIWCGEWTCGLTGTQLSSNHGFASPGSCPGLQTVEELAEISIEDRHIDGDFMTKDDFQEALDERCRECSPQEWNDRR